MIKLLIVDDEPLVQIGIKSMLDWNKLDIDICGCASNGEKALDLIDQEHPEIVLCDIKMPMMTGLELIKIVRQRYEELPVFIFLTSYDEFDLVKEAIHYHAFEYMIKLDLDAEHLKEVIQRALKKVYSLKAKHQEEPTYRIQDFYEKFMVRLLNGLFDDERQLKRQADELGISFDGKCYSVCLCSISTLFDDLGMVNEKYINLYISATSMIASILKKHISCYITTLDLKRFCIIVSHTTDDKTLMYEQLNEGLKNAFEMIKNYFNIIGYASIGQDYSEPIKIADSYQDARQLHSLCRPDQAIVFYEEGKAGKKRHNTFHLGLFKQDIQMAFESYDLEAFDKTINRLIELFEIHPNMFLQSMDAASNLLYLTLSLLPNSDIVLSKIFQAQAEGYRCLYSYQRSEQVVEWLQAFSQGIGDHLKSHHKTFKNHMIRDIQNYIDSHVSDKLTLNDMAQLFSISPSYLSVLFKKTTGIGFNEYVTNKKIAKAKAKLQSGHILVYELAEELGFESAFYFSKVFKKVVGCSPKAYVEGLEK